MRLYITYRIRLSWLVMATACRLIRWARQGSQLIETPEKKPRVVRLLHPLSIFSVVLLLGVGDPIVPFDALRVGIELLGNFFDILRFPTSDLDKRAGAHLIQGVSKDRPNSVNLFEIIRLNVLTDFGRSSL